MTDQRQLPQGHGESFGIGPGHEAGKMLDSYPERLLHRSVTFQAPGD